MCGARELAYWVLFAFLLVPVGSHAQTARRLGWAIDPQGEVEASVRCGDVLYLGGHFGGVFPLTGGGVIVDPTSGGLVALSPCVAGTVNASVPDGRGGWFIAGAFTAVNGLPRRNLAHILADGRVAGWNPDADGEVHCLGLAGNILYVGGLFGSVAGASHHGVAGLDAVTGTALPWGAAVAGDVRAICWANGTLLIGGSFPAVSGEPRSNLAALDAASGALRPWDPKPDAAVLSMVSWQDTVLVGGRFHHIGGTPRELLASVLLSSGAPTEFNASLSQSPPVTGLAPEIRALLLDGHRLYVGGVFDHAGLLERQGLVAVDRTDGRLLDFDPGLRGGQLPGFCGALALKDRSLYVAGSFQELGGANGNSLAGAVDAQTGSRLPWNFLPNQLIRTISASGAGIFAGGILTGVGERVPRAGLAAFDLKSGDLLPWAPSLDGDVYSMAARGGLVYLGGSFFTVGGQPHQSLAAVDAVSGEPTGWSPSCDGPVLSIQLSDSLLYAGGHFSQLGGVPRSNIGAVSVATGAPTAWNPVANDLVESIAVTPSAVYACGFFTVIGGQPRNFVAALGPATGRASPWRTQTLIGGDFIAARDSIVYVAGAVVSVPGDLPVNALVAVSAKTGASMFLDTLDHGSPDASSRVLAMAERNGVVYIGGDFSFVGPTSRPKCAAIDGKTGRVLDWDASIQGPVFGLSADSLCVTAGGRVNSAAGIPCGQFAVLSPAATEPGGEGPPAPALALRVATPSSGSVIVEFSLGTQSRATLSLYDVLGRRVLTTLDDVSLPPGHHVEVIDASSCASGAYFCRLEAAGSRAAGKVMIVR